MAKGKKPLIKSKRIGPLIYTERVSKKDSFTHNVRITRLKPKKKSKN